jgi:Na+/melibiose symporter-like transporter
VSTTLSTPLAPLPQGTTPAGTDVRAHSPAFGVASGLRYGALGLPLAFLALPLYVVLPSHYALQFGVPLASLGAVLLATRALDALLDPMIGGAVDRMFARSPSDAGPGAARSGGWSFPLTLAAAAAAAVVIGAGFTGLFFPPSSIAGVTNAGLLTWLAATLMLTYLAFSLLSVIHQAWGTRLGGDAPQRARIVAWRESFGLVGVLAASIVPALFGMGVASALLAVTLALGVALLARAPRVPQLSAPARGDRWLPWRDARFRALIAVFMLNGIASAVPATLVLFFVRDRLQLPAWEPAFLFGYFAAAALSVPLWVRLVKRVGLVHAWLAGIVLAVAAFAIALTLGVGDGAGFLAVCVASGVALGADLTIPGALLTGAIDRAGHRAGGDGIYLGWWNAATKLNLGLAAGAALPLLALAGYAPGARDAQALGALAIAYVAVPCTLKTLAGALLWRWRKTLEDR